MRASDFMVLRVAATVATSKVLRLPHRS